MTPRHTLLAAALCAALAGPAAATPQIEWVKTGCVIIDDEVSTVAINMKAERDSQHVKFTFRNTSTGQERSFLRWIRFIPLQQTMRFQLAAGNYTLSVQHSNNPDDRGIATQNDIVVPPFVVETRNGAKFCGVPAAPGTTTPQR